MKSGFFKLNWKDFGKGLLVTVLGAAVGAVQNGLSTGSIDPKQVGTIGASAGLAYLVKNLFENSDGSIGPDTAK
jgi:hypothetical protein